MQKLLIVDDHRIFTEGIHFLIGHTTALKVAGVIHLGREVMPFLKCNEIDLVLLDVDLPDISGIEVAREIRTAYPSLKILALSMLDDYYSVSRMMEAGADGYCIKTCGLEEILDAILKLKKGEKHMPVPHADILKKEAKTPRHMQLTPREMEIVRLIAKGLTTDQIADSLFISPRTVETHRKNIYQKLNLHTNIELIQYSFKKKWL